MASNTEKMRNELMEYVAEEVAALDMLPQWFADKCAALVPKLSDGRLEKLSDHVTALGL